MGAHMTTGLPGYDVTDDADARVADAQPVPCDSTECATTAPESVGRLYRKPQVHFCCTTAAMRAVESLCMRWAIPHVCLSTGRPDDGLAWRVATSPRGHRLLVESGALVEIDAIETNDPGKLDRRCSPKVPSTPSSKMSTVVSPSSTSMTANARAAQSELPTKEKDSKSAKAPRRRRRRRRHAARTPMAERAAVPLSV